MIGIVKAFVVGAPIGLFVWLALEFSGTWVNIALIFAAYVLGGVSKALDQRREK